MEQCNDHTGCAERIRAVEESTKSAHHRIDDVVENQKILMEMNANIKLLAEQYKSQADKIGTIEDDIKDLKDKPAQRWESIVNAVIVSIASGIAGAVLMLVLK